MVNSWLVSGLPFDDDDKPRKLSDGEVEKLRLKIEREVENLKNLGASDEVINEFLERCEKLNVI